MVDSMTDETTIIFAAASAKSGSLGQKPAIFINTTDEYVLFAVDFKNMDYMNEDHVLEYRFDKEPMGKLNSIANKTASCPFFVKAKSDNKDFQNFLDSLLKHETLTVRVTALGGSSVSASFNITGLGNEIKKRKLKGTVLEEYIK